MGKEAARAYSSMQGSVLQSVSATSGFIATPALQMAIFTCGESSSERPNATTAEYLHLKHHTHNTYLKDPKIHKVCENHQCTKRPPMVTELNHTWEAFLSGYAFGGTWHLSDRTW